MTTRFKDLRNPIAAALFTAFLAACGSDSATVAQNNFMPEEADNFMPGESDPPPVQMPVLLVANAQNPDYAGEDRVFTNPACDADGNPTREGGQQHNIILQSASNETIAFSVFEPANFDCTKGNPIVLHGHGYGGSRAASPTGVLADLVDSGAGVITIDQRGYGESGGTVRVMDPDFEGQDLLQILDWAEANLDWLRYRNDDTLSEDRDFNMVAGATGSSYGGGYQLLIHNIDPLGRLDVLTPDITWNDLRYSLHPGAVYGVQDYTPEDDGQIAPTGVVKSGWGLFLVAVGEAGSSQNGGQDPLIRETLTRAIASNQFPQESLEFFRYHSPSYYCDPEVAGEQALLSAQGLTPQDPQVAQATPRPVDILFTQGFRDSLFNFNDAFHNFACYRSLTDADGNKADVRLFTHQTGHILGASTQGVPGFEELATAGLINFPEFDTPTGEAKCGDTSLGNAQFAFLIQKLFTAEEQVAILAELDEEKAAAFQSLDDLKGEVFLSHADTSGEAVFVDD
ncbi:MAG: CocE/NonD family hydrolase [Limnobacter sp.]|nr:CocE/NonD family hydrolase [Limnobacter sp.]